jgi:general secretion pathway protein G
MNDERGTMTIPLQEEAEAPTGGAVHRSSFIVPRSSEKGFSLLELIVVVTIIGILAAAAMVSVRYSVRKAKEAALRDNLATMRKAIDSYYADKQKYPSSLEDLVPNYIRRIPKDPLTDQTDWELVMDDPLSSTGTDGEFMSSETDPEAMSQPGVQDVKSTAVGTTLDNVPYSDL